MSIISCTSGLSLKVSVVSICVLSVGIMLKQYSVVPLMSDFVASYVPSSWNVMLRWLKPPYLYLVINGIIISIVASSKLQHRDDDDPSSYNQISVPPPPEKVIIPSEDLSDNDNKVLMMDGGGGVAEVVKLVTPPPLSARFGHRKAVRASPEGGKALRVAKSKRNDTLESTWKTITEGRAMPLTRHLKKSDAWDSHVRHNTPPPEPAAPKMKKAGTFHEGGGKDNSGRLNREPSPGQDELNRRVEAFIKKFNEEMRLQRQRSLEQYNQMINREPNLIL